MSKTEYAIECILENFTNTGATFEDIGGGQCLETLTIGNLSLTRDEVLMAIGSHWLTEIEAVYNEAHDEDDASYLETIMSDGEY